MTNARLAGMFALVFLVPGVRPLLAQPTTRVSVDSNGIQGDQTSWLPAISADGRYVAFESAATNLVPGDTNARSDVFVRDLVGSRTVRVSVSSSGAQAKGGGSFHVAVSSDGRFVAFASDAKNLVSGDGNGYTDVFRHDRDADGNGIFDEPSGISTIRVSVDSGGAEGNFFSDYPSISGDGRFVAFASAAWNLVPGDSNDLYDVFVHDCQTGRTVRVSVDDSGQEADGDSGPSVLSTDGRFVAFSSNATNLVASDTNGCLDIFVHDRDADGNGVFDESGGILTTRASVDSAGGESNGSSTQPSMSADARFVAFASDAVNLVGGDTNGRSDAFVHDRLTGETTRVSVDSAGAQGNSESGYPPSISVDGRFVAFASIATNLVSDDTNSAPDVFVRDRETGITTRVSLDSAGTETGNNIEGGAFDPAISGDGRLVAFESLASDLVPGDTNVASDVFLRDRIDLHFNGVPSYPNSVNYTLTNANGDTGKLALVMLSCTGIGGFALPDGRTILLTFDACTVLGFQFSFILSGTVDGSGSATTPLFQFPLAPPGVTIDCAAVTIDLPLGKFVSISGPIAFVTQ
ncbi:MAG: calcium-binding protein [Planctomycetota bacterium]